MGVLIDRMTRINKREVIRRGDRRSMANVTMRISWQQFSAAREACAELPDGSSNRHGEQY